MIMNPGYKKIIRHWITIVLLLLPSLVFSAEPFVIVANNESPLNSISREQAFDLYLGRIQHVNGYKIHLIDLNDSNKLRAVFYKHLGNMNLSQVNAYWARLQFTGKVFPPTSLADEQSVMERIGKDINSIGYISQQEVPQQYKVLCCND